MFSVLLLVNDDAGVCAQFGDRDDQLLILQLPADAAGLVQILTAGSPLLPWDRDTLVRQDCRIEEAVAKVPAAVDEVNDFKVLMLALSVRVSSTEPSMPYLALKALRHASHWQGPWRFML